MDERIITDMLIEGFDPSKLENEEQKREEAWKKVIGAYQNRKILEAKMFSIEDLEMPDGKKETCAVVEIEQVRGFIPINEFGVERKREMRAYGGQDIAFVVLNYDRENDVFIASRTQAMEIMADLWLKKDEIGRASCREIRYV